MRWASIDIGTNTLRLLIADIDNKIPKRRDKKLKPIIVKRIITRLGGDYTEQGGIDREAKERTIGALKIFSEKIKEYHVKQVTDKRISCKTSNGSCNQRGAQGKE